MFGLASVEGGIKPSIGRHRPQTVARFEVRVGPCAEAAVEHALDRDPQFLAYTGTYAVAPAHRFALDFLIKREVLPLFERKIGLKLLRNVKYNGHTVGGLSAHFSYLEVVESV